MRGRSSRARVAKLENAIGSAEAQVGRQRRIVDEQRGMLMAAEKYAADVGTRDCGELSTAVSARVTTEKQYRQSAT